MSLDASQAALLNVSLGARQKSKKTYRVLMFFTLVNGEFIQALGLPTHRTTELHYLAAGAESTVSMAFGERTLSLNNKCIAKDLELPV